MTALISAFNNCGGAKSASAGSNGASSSGGGMAAFQVTLYAWGKANNCTVCHASSIKPFFVSPSLATAYADAKDHVDFNNTDASTFIAHSSNGHCNGAANCNTASNATTMAALLKQWAAAENAAPVVPGGGGSSSVKYKTTAVALPATIPNLTKAPAVVRFQLSGLSPAVASLNGAIMEVEVQTPSMGEYRFNRLKIMGNTAAVSITGVHVYIKASGSSGLGVEDDNQGMGWVAGISGVTAPVSTLPGTLPTGPLSATPISSFAIQTQAQSTADMITIGIEDIQ